LASEGAYTLRTETNNNDTFVLPPKSYSQLDTNVVFQDGLNIDQYTILFHNDTTNEQAIVKVRFSPRFFKEIIEYEVELNSISLQENKGKDVTVNWKMYDGFDPRN
jgi:hypothetical protein